EDTVVQLEEKRHVWDVRGGKYLGFVDNFKIKLDLYPKFFALLPANPGAVKLTPEKTRVKQGEILRCVIEVPFKEGADEAIRKLGHVVHIEVLDPAGKELEWYRDNILIEGSRSTVQIPISFSEKPGRYTLKARSPITGGTAAVNVQVE
ncbi:MAG: hypothetical protein NTX84_07795, partial [Nitrospirae bacterium]|nr:hypothetical protein [Nitrospirota bacterium]